MAIREDNVSIEEEFLQIDKDIPPLWKIKSSEYHDKQLNAVFYDYLFLKKLKEIKSNTTKDDLGMFCV